MSPGSDGLKVGYPAPDVRRTGIKWCYVCVPRKAAHNCCPIRSLLAGGPRNSNLCPQQSRRKCPWRGPRNSNLCPQQSRKKISMARSEEQQFMSIAIPKKKYPWRGPRTAIYVHSNLQKMSLARSEEQQFMSAAIPNNVHGQGRGTAIYVHNNPEKCP